MVNIYVFNPSHKLRFLSKLFYQGTKRILKNVQVDAPAGLPATARPRKANIAYPQGSDFSFELSSTTSALRKPIRDPDYYKDENQGGFCIFRVENTLFRVHRFFLTREPSAFEDMLSFPQKRFSNNGTCDENPIVLSDKVEQFRDLLWALYALPHELHRVSDPHVIPPLEKLLNIAEMSNKYCFASFESWSVERIYALAKDTSGPLRNASPRVYARVLTVAVLSDHPKLLEMVTKKLISRILWHNMPPEPILPIADKYGLRELQGICYYRQLTSMERDSPYYSSNSNSSQLAIPLTFSVEKRVRYFSAHRSLVELWERLRSSPPSFYHDGCPSHGHCLITLTHLWYEVGSSVQTLQYGPADVLGKLKILMINLRNAMNNTPTISVQCTLSALEAIAMTRDEIIGDLIDYFQEP
ncbi:hypothetical protein AX17_006632 [Amanita inopinata Kibby_2008]|nr:hypothetical protein AX17_006632 [Amanita inopinata Kibby_2008]